MLSKGFLELVAAPEQALPVVELAELLHEGLLLFVFLAMQLLEVLVEAFTQPSSHLCYKS